MDDATVPARRPQRRDSARAQRAAATRQALIGAARTLFTARGYHAVGVRDVTAQAGVTRGAFSHHFAGKEALFLAVFEAVETDLTASLAAQAVAADPWSQLRASLQLYLDAARRPEVQQITLIDGPAVLGWRRWREVEEGFGLGALTQALQAAMDGALIRPRPVEPLAHLIFGSVMEAAMLIAHSEDGEARRREVGAALDDLLRGLE